MKRVIELSHKLESNCSERSSRAFTLAAFEGILIGNVHCMTVATMGVYDEDNFMDEYNNVLVHMERPCNYAEKQSVIETFYNVYKSVHGVKPRWMDLDSMTVEKIREELADLGQLLIVSDDCPSSAEEQLRKTAEYMLAAGAPDWATAMRWARQAM